MKSSHSLEYPFSISCFRILLCLPVPTTTLLRVLHLSPPSPGFRITTPSFVYTHIHTGFDTYNRMLYL
ncbi:hypothetical protein BDN72DRAFT_412110 [Pluteus cervinus]|uniref:Uncharacterized protein n=1 Tax=Pluteus cervinus TaxID=181527 RepID=A0ACD3A8K0_9AGAR|nr:hypothetical protein BDN72DRAFT_412110 [Pluteus cervinus]